MGTSSSSLVGRSPTTGVVSIPSSARSCGISSRPWSDLCDDLLVSIFSRLGSVDLILLSSVCSSWRAAARNPRFWRILDLSDWEYITARIPVSVTFKQVFSRVLGFVQQRELIEEVYCPPVAHGLDLLFVSERLPNLLYVSFPSLQVSEWVLCSFVSNFKSLKGLAVHKTLFMRLRMVSLLGTLFPDLSELKIYGRIYEEQDYLVIILVIIQVSLPKLRKLEIPFFRISTDLTLMLLDSLKHLEYLDISGYIEPKITKEIVDKASRLKVFIWRSESDLEGTC